MKDIKASLLGLVNDPSYQPLKKSELAIIFDIDETKAKFFNEVIKELTEEGRISVTKKGRITRPKRSGTIVGKFVAGKSGFGFVDAEEEGVDSLFIPADSVNGAMNGDKVAVELISQSRGDRKAEGAIVEILERGNETLVGMLQINGNFGFVIPDDKRLSEHIFVPKKFFSGAVTRDKVVCRITSWPEIGKKAEGKIIEVLGQKGTRGVEIESIIRKHNLPEEFPKKVIKEAREVAISPTEEEINRRVDLRDLNTFTIDGADSKDLDDAVSVEKLDNGNYRLGVHIADVTHYVKENSQLDKEALKRGTSVYLVDKVIPMLPTELSNGVSSLNPYEDKLTLSVIMEVDKYGKVVDYDIVESVINSKARMTYTEVSDILENDDEKLKKTFAAQVDSFKAAEELANILRKKRIQRGAIDFDFPESKIVLDSEGNVVDIKEYERRIADKIIEEFMILTNETVAEHFARMEVPFIYRVHDYPSLEKMELLNEYMAPYGYFIRGNLEEINPKKLQEILEQLDGKKEKDAISTIMLRSFKHASYSPQETGHFGLGADYYSHFTSPIRRYPDLEIHRIIKDSLNGRLTEKRIAQLEPIVAYASEHSSEQEREAEYAEREVDDYYKAVYMLDKVGQEFTGKVSGVTSFGMFVELDNSVEGLVRLIDMGDDYYIFDEKLHRLIGERTHKTYGLGDMVEVKVESVNPDFREIDFSLVGVSNNRRKDGTVREYSSKYGDSQGTTGSNRTKETQGRSGTKGTKRGQERKDTKAIKHTQGRKDKKDKNSIAGTNDRQGINGINATNEKHEKRVKSKTGEKSSARGKSKDLELPIAKKSAQGGRDPFKKLENDSKGKKAKKNTKAKEKAKIKQKSKGKPKAKTKTKLSTKGKSKFIPSK
jgi:ribonuclease R